MKYIANFTPFTPIQSQSLHKNSNHYIQAGTKGVETDKDLVHNVVLPVLHYTGTNKVYKLDGSSNHFQFGTLSAPVAPGGYVVLSENVTGATGETVTVTNLSIQNGPADGVAILDADPENTATTSSAVSIARGGGVPISLRKAGTPDRAKWRAHGRL